MIAPNSIASRKTIEPVIPTTRRIRRGYAAGLGGHGRHTTCQGEEGVRRRSRRLQGCARAERRGIEPRDSASAGSRWRTRKCTESVSPSSSSPDRPSPKRLPGGRAFNLQRSVLGALGKIVADYASVKRFERVSVANCGNHHSNGDDRARAVRRREFHNENAPSPVLPRPTLDRPPPKRLPVGEPSTSGAPSSVHLGH